MTEQIMEAYQARLNRLNDAIALREPDRVPICAYLGIIPYVLDGCTYRDAMYNYPRAKEAIINYFKKYPMSDAALCPRFSSGKANELAGTTMLDWPGRPGTKVPDLSTYQVQEFEYMKAEEYDEVLKDFTGFMLRKYIPRAWPNLSGLANIRFNPSNLLGTAPLSGLYAPETVKAYEILAEMAKDSAECAKANGACGAELNEMGFPPFTTGMGEVPFDIIGDYFRSTLPTLLDQMEHEEELEAFCDRLVEIEIESFRYLENPDIPVKRVMFPMHKGMDGFMSGEQYERLYWRPFRKVIDALIEMGVTPYLYTEGRYNTRLEQLKDLPKGKCMIHFEQVDIRQAKKILGDNSCIVGNFPALLLQTGTPHQVEEKVKELLDICMPGGGYVFDCDGSIDLAEEANLDAMYNAVVKYGSYR